jgi:hypothetical protein
MDLEAGEADELGRTQRGYHELAEPLSKDQSIGRAERKAQLAALANQQDQAIRELPPESPGAFEAWQRQQASSLKDTFSLRRENPVGDRLKQP